MEGFIRFGGDVATVTVTSADDLTIVINENTYTEAFDSDIDTTITNWVATYSATLEERGILAIKTSSTDIELTGVEADKVSTGDGTVASSYNAELLPIGSVAAATVSSSTIVFATSATNTSYDVLTVTYLNAASAIAAHKQLSRSIRYITSGAPVVQAEVIGKPAVS